MTDAPTSQLAEAPTNEAQPAVPRVRVLLTVVGGADLEETENPDCLWHGGCPRPAWSAFRAMHHVVVEIRVGHERIDGRVLCGPRGSGRSNRTDITCEQGSVVDQFTILTPRAAREAELEAARARNAGARSSP